MRLVLFGASSIPRLRRDGGLVGYGVKVSENYQQAADYVEVTGDVIFAGERWAYVGEKITD